MGIFMTARDVWHETLGHHILRYISNGRFDVMKVMINLLSAKKRCGNILIRPILNVLDMLVVLLFR